MNEKLKVSISPHIHKNVSVEKMMKDVLIALLPVGIFSVYLYNFYSLGIIVVSIISCCLTELVCQKLMKRKVTIKDLSAVVTGLLLAYTLPPGLPIWMVVLGSIFAIFVGKQVFGGLGHNPFNPALLGRAFLQISWPKEMSTWLSPIDCTTTATPLTITKLKLAEIKISYLQLFLGNYAGCIGETSKLLLILGFIYLLTRKVITGFTPISYIFTVAIISLIFKQNVLFHILSGGLFLGAIFMATDPVTSPLTSKGKTIFGLGCGILTMFIRLTRSYPEGVCFSILIMNALTPLIDRYTRPKRFGIR